MEWMVSAGMNEAVNENSRLIVLDVDLAAEIGLSEALIVQQIHYWLKQKKNYRDGRYWVYNSYPDWLKQFPFMTSAPLRNKIKRLEEKNILITANHNKTTYDRTKWYTINYDAPELERWRKNFSPPYPVEQSDLSVQTQAESLIMSDAIDKNSENDEEIRNTSAQFDHILCSNQANGYNKNEHTNTMKYPNIITENNSNKYRRDFSAQESAEKPRTQKQTPFDWKILEREIKKSCDNLDVDGELREDVIGVIEYYYDTYMWKNGKEHPRLSQEKMDDVVFRLITDTSDNGGSMFVLGDVADVDSYKIMIDAYFATDFPNCDYNICHFVSGTIRDNRFYEKCYR